MITLEELQNLSKARLEDAQVLYNAGRRDWAVYTCGYAVELALKKKICETLRWKGFPNTDKEFEGLKSFKTHRLDTLLHLSGVESQIQEDALAEWSIVASWDPEERYFLRKQTEQSASLLLEPVERLLKKL